MKRTRHRAGEDHGTLILKFPLFILMATPTFPCLPCQSERYPISNCRFRFTKPVNVYITKNECKESPSCSNFVNVRLRADARAHTDSTRFRCQQTVRGSSQRKTVPQKEKKVYPHHHLVHRPQHTAYCDIITFIKHYLLIPRYRKKN